MVAPFMETLYVQIEGEGALGEGGWPCCVNVRSGGTLLCLTFGEYDYLWTKVGKTRAKRK